MAMSLDVGKIKEDFPVLQRNINGKPLIYLDSANTSQKPASVMDAMENYYRKFNANVQGDRTNLPMKQQLFLKEPEIKFEALLMQIQGKKLYSPRMLPKR